MRFLMSPGLGTSALTPELCEEVLQPERRAVPRLCHSPIMAFPHPQPGEIKVSMEMKQKQVGLINSDFYK